MDLSLPNNIHQLSDADYARALAAMIANRRRKVAAHEELMNLRQGRQTARDYFARFEQLQLETGYDDPLLTERLIDIMEQQVNPRIIDSIYLTGDIPTDYDAYKERIIRIDELWIRRRAEARLSQKQIPTSSSTTNTGNSSTPNVAKSPIDLIKYKVSAEERTARRAVGLCMVCGKKWPCTDHRPSRWKTRRI